MAAQKPGLDKLTIDQFKRHFDTNKVEGLDRVLSQINGGSLMECHRKLYEATGIWIDELTPVFQMMDAMIVTRDLRPGR